MLFTACAMTSPSVSLTIAVSRIALVREQRARSIEDLLLRMARSGQLRGRVSEDQLLGLLEQIESSERSQGAAGSGPSKIVVRRRGIGVS